MRVEQLEQKEAVQDTGAGEKLIRVLFFTLILSVMNASMFNVVLPTISKEFQITSSQVSWIVTGYMIVYAIGSVTYGKLADKYRIKDLITFGLIVFALGSVVGVFATQYWMVILGRVLQSAGASVIPAIAMIIPVKYFPPEKRGRALGTTASGLALGTAIGPIVSGLVSSVTSWRVLFLLSVLALATLPFYRKYLDDERGTTTKTDMLGGLLLAGTVASLLLAITYETWLLFLLGVVFFLLLVVRLRKASSPFIQPALFKNKQYSFGVGTAFLATGLAFGIPFLTPQLLANVNHLSPAMIGLIMFPGAIASALLGRKGGRLADEKGNLYLFYLATAFQFVAYSLLSITAGLSPYLILIVLISGNLGQTFMQIAMSNTISRTLPKDQIGVGMGLFSMLNFIAGATATTLIGKTLDLGASAQFNPFLMNHGAIVYSNIFLALAALVILVIILYRSQHRTVK